MNSAYSGPKCPNHGCRLLVETADRMKKKGQSRCEVSGALFDWQQRTHDQSGNQLKDKFGNIFYEFTVTGDGEDSVKET